MPTVKRPHTIPKFFLRHFAHEVGDEFFVWVFRSGVPEPYRENIKNVSVEKGFYGPPGANQIEKQLDGKETQFGVLIKELRSFRSVRSDQGPAIAELFAHLSWRTPHSRDGHTEMFEKALEVVDRQLSGGPASGALAILLEAKLRDAMTDPALRARLDTLPSAQREQVLQRLASLKPSDMLQGARELYHAERDKIDVQREVTQAHLKGLDKSAVHTARAADFARLTWRLIRSSQGSLILGDVGPVGRFNGSAELKSIIADTTPDAVFLPISHEDVVAGFFDPKFATIEVEELNVATAACSREFFIAHQRTDRERRYVEHLGKRASFLTDEKMQESFDSAMDEIRTRRTDPS